MDAGSVIFLEKCLIQPADREGQVHHFGRGLSLGFHLVNVIEVRSGTEVVITRKLTDVIVPEKGTRTLIVPLGQPLPADADIEVRLTNLFAPQTTRGEKALLVHKVKTMGVAGIGEVEADRRGSGVGDGQAARLDARTGTCLADRHAHQGGDLVFLPAAFRVLHDG